MSLAKRFPSKFYICHWSFACLSNVHFADNISGVDIISQSTRCLKGLFTKYLHLSHKEVFTGQVLFLEAVGSRNWCLYNQLYYIYLNKCGAGYLTFHTSLVSGVFCFHPTCSADWLDDIKCLWPSSSQVAKGMSKWYCAISLHFFRFQNSLRNLMNKG